MADPVTAILAAATLVTTGALASAATAAADTSAELGPWIQGGSAVLAVGALGYIARMLADGRLVARSTSITEASLAQTNAQLADLLTQAQKREDRLYDLARHHEGDGK